MISGERVLVSVIDKKAQKAVRVSLGLMARRLTEIQRMLHTAPMGVGRHQAEAWAEELDSFASSLIHEAAALRRSTDVEAHTPAAEGTRESP